MLMCLLRLNKVWSAAAGRGLMAPLLHAGNKLYLTTTDFRRKYYDYVMEASDWIEMRLGRNAGIEKDEMSGFDILRL